MPPKKLKTADTATTSNGKRKSKAAQKEVSPLTPMAPTVTEESKFTPVNLPDFDALHWIPIKKLGEPFQSQISSIALPFRGVKKEDIAEVLRCFGGSEKVAAVLKSGVKNPKLNFNLCQTNVAPQLFSQTQILSQKPLDNAIVMEVIFDNVEESEEEKHARARKEQTLVQRQLGLPLLSLPPRILSATLTHVLPSVFEFTQLYDYYQYPATPKDRFSLTANPDMIRMTSIVPSLLPVFPLPEASNSNAELHFHSRKYTNISGFGRPDFIPSMYSSPAEATDRSVIRMRKAHAQIVKWPDSGEPDYPAYATEGALSNLNDKVPHVIVKEAKKILSEQPVWQRRMFYRELYRRCPNLLKEHCRFILPGLAYRFSNGPWTRLWCRFGFNPGSSAENRRLQILDYRINHNLLTKRRTLSKKNPDSETRSAIKNLIEKLGTLANPRGYQFMVQLYRFEGIKEIRNILNSSNYCRDYCDPKEGFFKKGSIDQIRLALTVAIENEDSGLECLDDIVKPLQEIGLFKNVVYNKNVMDIEDEGAED